MTDSSTGFGLVAQARSAPTAIALIAGARSVTYGELNARARRIAQVLSAVGVEADQRVAVLVGNTIEWFEVVHGIGRLGAVTVPINIHFKEAEIRHLVDDSGAAVIVTDPLLYDPPDDLASRCLRLGADWEASLAGVDDDVDVELGGPGADAWPTMMTYTSGTTGRPKGVAIGADDFRRRADGIALMASPWSLGSDDVHLLVGPTYHAGPGVWAQVHLAVGATVVVMEHWDAGAFLRLIAQHRVTTTHVVPANFIRLLDVDPAVREEANLSSLRVVWHAAAPCPIPVKREIMQWFPDGVVWEYYGASEGGGTSISPGEWLKHPGSVGRPYPGNEFRITDDDHVVLEAGQPGRIWVRTQGSSFAYHDDPEKTRVTHDADGFFSVGDVGYLDDEGYLYITDRISDMVISGGVNIYPREVENCLYEHPSILDCAVFGVPDAQWGEVLVALVQLVDGTALSEDEVVQWCRDHLADYKRPRAVEFVVPLPREPNGKVVKSKLREAWLAGHST